MNEPDTVKGDRCSSDELYLGKLILVIKSVDIVLIIVPVELISLQIRKISSANQLNGIDQLL